jgi:hypothetical protein
VALSSVGASPRRQKTYLPYNRGQAVSSRIHDIGYIYLVDIYICVWAPATSAMFVCYQETSVIYIKAFETEFWWFRILTKGKYVTEKTHTIYFEQYLMQFITTAEIFNFRPRSSFKAHDTITPYVYVDLTSQKNLSIENKLATKRISLEANITYYFLIFYNQ